MTNYYQPYIRCPEPPCQKEKDGQKILLPCPTHTGSTGHPENLIPKDWQLKLNLICPRCKRGNTFSADDVVWESIAAPWESRTHLAFWRVTIECERRNCKTPNKWHWPGNATDSKDVIEQVFESVKQHLLCDNGRHEIPRPFRILLPPEKCTPCDLFPFLQP